MGFRAILIMLAASVALAGCGIKGNLTKPKDIPALEKKKEDRLRKLQNEPEA